MTVRRPVSAAVPPAAPQGPRPPQGAARVERPDPGGGPPEILRDPPPDFEAREGDVLVVSYPEITIPLKQYASCKVGGLIYTRRMLAGDSVADQFERVYRYLEKRAEADARDKVRKYAEELRRD